MLTSHHNGIFFRILDSKSSQQLRESWADDVNEDLLLINISTLILFSTISDYWYQIPSILPSKLPHPKMNSSFSPFIWELLRHAAGLHPQVLVYFRRVTQIPLASIAGLGVPTPASRCIRKTICISGTHCVGFITDFFDGDYNSLHLWYITHFTELW